MTAVPADSAARRAPDAAKRPGGEGVRGLLRRPGALVARFPVASRTLGAVVAGLLIYASFPPRTCWYLAPLGIAVLTLVVRGPGRLRGGFGYGLVAGLAFFVPLLPWTGIYVGPVPWLALSAACAVYVGLFGLLARLVSGQPGWPLWVAALWTLTEWGRSSFPFGGFPWGRLAFGQADGWYLPLAMLAGAPGVSFAVALTGTLLAAFAIRLGDRRGPGWVAGIGTVAILVAIIPGTGVILRTALPAPDDGDRPITVAAIQGSVPRLGLDFNAQRRAVLDNHVRRTEELARAVAAGQARQPDVVIWPENSSDIDPLRNADAAREIGAVSAAIHAPILVGAVLVNSDRTTTNSVLVWNGTAGPGERHDKRIIQPFGEYLPLRGFFRHFSEYADRAGYFVPGHGDGVVHAQPASGGPPIAVGVATCYEVAFDRAFEDSLRAGAELLTVPTNNATFGDSEMTYQQLAMSRVRAVEHGRALVVAATSGVSAIVTADGALARQTPKFVPAALEATLPLRTATTPATRWGPWPERMLCILAAAVVVVVVTRRRISPPEHPVDEDAPGDRAHH
ncbi:apolipoprotein N-acyltransferase [Nocardia blacklockiae]|uniref:apolipoprotein N-acyltransferase n=1 Tax=Nocardia blacklockiae TaxID=480036 RepID=UPI001895FD1E|nr:apolipoprotein N-acyltransferase [Nocardia blacklockiae]MBF6170575.1 apolipoprotein N-acyltransferase [Nocardia blacklockiae]